MNYALYDGNKLNLLYKKYTIYVFCHNYHNHHQYVHNYTKPLLAIIACIHSEEAKPFLGSADVFLRSSRYTI